MGRGVAGGVAVGVAVPVGAAVEVGVLVAVAVASVAPVTTKPKARTLSVFVSLRRAPPESTVQVTT